jgi:cell division septum initiation protein DivIVA
MDLDEFFDDNKIINVAKDKPSIEDKPFFIKNDVKSNKLEKENVNMNNNEDLKKEVSDIILEAKRQAEEIITNAKNQASIIINQANKIKIESYIYADNLFKKLELEISKMLKEVRNGREFLKEQKNK